MKKYLALLAAIVVALASLDARAEPRSSWTRAAILYLSPRTPIADADRLASAIDLVLREDGPIFAGPDGERRSRALMVAIAFRESSFRLDVVGDQGRSVCAYQILDGDRKLLADVTACARVGARMVRESFAACRSLPVAERLAGYARGSCESAEGRRISRDRMWLAADAEKRTPREETSASIVRVVPY